jgi:hypothetical protein
MGLPIRREVLWIMARKRYTPETIILKLREVLQGQGKTVPDVVKHLGVTEQTSCDVL